MLEQLDQTDKYYKLVPKLILLLEYDKRAPELSYIL